MPTIREALSAKNGAGGPHLIGPTDIVKWATTNVGNYQRGATSLAQLETMMSGLFDQGAWASKGTCLRFTVGAPYIGAIDDLARGINGTTPRTFVPPIDSDYHKARFTKITKMMCAFALNMENWAYPACRHYHTISTAEAEDGVTTDFVTKHVSSTKDDKSTKKVAEIRGAPVQARQGVQAFGNIVTARSGGLLQEELGAFCAEIKRRQTEFTNTYAGLTQYFADNCEWLDGGGNANFTVLLDHVTFITQRAYKMYEYVGAKGGEDNVFIHFGVSSSADGKKWAVHHLARTSATRVMGGGTSAATLGIADADATTSLKDPFG